MERLHRSWRRQPVSDKPKPKAKVQARSRVRRHTLRLGLTAECFSKLGRAAPFLLNGHAREIWKKNDQLLPRFNCGRGHRPGTGERGCRDARAVAGVEDLTLSWHTPANDARTHKLALYMAMSWRGKCQIGLLNLWHANIHSRMSKKKEINTR